MHFTIENESINAWALHVSLSLSHLGKGRSMPTINAVKCNTLFSWTTDDTIKRKKR